MQQIVKMNLIIKLISMGALNQLLQVKKELSLMKAGLEQVVLNKINNKIKQLNSSFHNLPHLKHKLFNL